MGHRSSDIAIAQRATEQHGVLSTGELRDLGLSHDAIRDRERGGRLHRIHRGVYAIGHRFLTLEARFLAAVKACGPTAILSHFSAAVLWGLVDWDEDRYPEVTILDTTPRSHSGILVHRTTVMDPVDRTIRNGIPLTTPLRTVIDLAATTGDRGLRRLVRRAQGNHRIRLDQLARAVARLRPRPGIRKLTEIIATGPTPTRSELEDVVLDLILRGGFEPPDVNRPLRIGGRLVVPDFRWPMQRLIIEADGAAWHENPLARADDAERQALLEAAGERVLRVTWHQAVALEQQTINRIATAGAPSSNQLSTNSGHRRFS